MMKGRKATSIIEDTNKLEEKKGVQLILIWKSIAINQSIKRGFKEKGELNE